MRRPAPLLLLLLLLFPAVARPAAADEVDDVLRSLGSSDPRAREQAVRRLGEVVSTPRDRDRALGFLVRALVDPAKSVRQAAATSFARIEDPRSAAPLAARLEVERDTGVLAALLLGLGAVGGAGDVARVAAFARAAPVPSVRTAAVTALGDLGGETARRIVREVLVSPGLPDPDWVVRAAALLALATCGHAEDVGVALTAFREGGGEAHWFARCALAKLVTERDRNPLPLLRRLVLDPDPRVAVTAATGIARIGHVEEVLILLRHMSPTVRAAAASAVARAQVDAAYSRLKTLARYDRSRRVRWAASLALFRIEDPLGDEMVLLGLGSREPTVWAEAMAALSRRTGEDYGRDAKAWRKALKRWRQAR